MEFFNFILSPSVLIVLVGGVVSAILSYFSASKSEKTLKLLSKATLYASLLVIFGGILSGYSDFIKSKQLETKTDQIFALSKKNSDLGQQIAELSKRNQELNEYSINSITGGNSYCYYQLGINHSKPNNYLLRMLMHVGEFPIFDLSIRIVDSYKLSGALGNNKEFNLDKIRSAEQIIHKESYFKPGQGNIYEHVPELFRLPDDTDEQSY